MQGRAGFTGTGPALAVAMNEQIIFSQPERMRHITVCLEMLAEADRPVDAVLGEPFEVVASEPRTSLARREKKAADEGQKQQTQEEH